MLNGKDIQYLREILEDAVCNDDGYIRSIYHKLGRLGYYLNKVVMSEHFLQNSMEIIQKYHVPKILLDFDEAKINTLIFDFVTDHDLITSGNEEELKATIDDWLPNAILKQKTKL